MSRRSPGWTVYLSAFVFLGSCRSGTEPRAMLDPSPAVLAGRYAIASPITLANGSTTLADTLILGADRSLARRRLARGPGAIGDMIISDLGTYSVDGRTVVLAFSCLNGVCFGTQTVNASARGQAWQVTQLVLNEDGRTTTYDRVQ